MTIQNDIGNRTMVVPPDTGSSSNIDILHEIGSRFAASDPLHTVLERVLQFVTAVIQCDSCFIYVLEDNALVLRASKNRTQTWWTS